MAPEICVLELQLCRSLYAANDSPAQGKSLSGYVLGIESACIYRMWSKMGCRA